MDHKAGRLFSTRTLVFAVLCGMAFVMYIDRTNISVAAPLIRKEFNISNTEMGMVFSAFSIAYACFMIVGGWFSDRIGPRNGLTIAGVLWAGATMVTAAVSSLATLVAVRFLVGVSESPVYPTAARMITNWVPEARRGSAQGVMHACGRIASSLAPLIVTALIAATSWRVAFAILGAISLCYVLAAHLVMRDHPREHPDTTPEELAELPPTVTKSGRAEHPTDWPKLLRAVWPATATCFCHGWMLWFFLNWTPSYFSQHYGMKLSKMAIFSTLVLLGGTLGTAAGGVISDWWLKRTGNPLRARRDIIVFGFASAALGLIPLLYDAGVTVCAISLGVAFFLSELADSPLWVVGMEVAPEQAATSSAATFTGMALAGAISPVIVGWSVDRSGGHWEIAFGMTIAVLLAGIALAYRIRLPAAAAQASSAPQAAPHTSARPLAG